MRVSDSTLNGRRGFSVARPTVWKSLPDFTRDPAVSTDGGYGCNFSPGEGLSLADVDNVARCDDMMLCGSRIWYDRIDSVLPSTL